MPQRFTASPDPVSRGGQLAIDFKNADLANTSVTIDVVDSENGTSTTVKIDLDATGKGSTSFTVPQSWGAFIVLEHPTSQDLTVAVTNPPTPSAKKSPKKKPPVRGAKKRR